jgi:hypothetical protein
MMTSAIEMLIYCYRLIYKNTVTFLILYKNLLSMTGKPQGRFSHLTGIFQAPSLEAENGGCGSL